MATYTVTTANWNDGAWWASVGPSGPGNLLDFSALPSNYTVHYDFSTGEITISDGTSTFSIGDATATGGPYDATMGGASELNFFDFLGSQGDDTIIADGNANAIDGGGGIDGVDYSGSGSGVNVDLSTGTGSGGDAAGDTYASVENVTGSDFDDTITGNGSANVIDGGAGNDTISGGSAGRTSFSWSDIPDPDDGGQIDVGDAITSATVTVGTVDVTVTAPVSVDAGFTGDTQATSGIDGGAGGFNANSALDLPSTGSGTTTIDFSTEVGNVAFRINDFDGGNEDVTVRMYDADGNLVGFTSTLGSNVTGTDTDAMAGDDQFTATSGVGNKPDTNLTTSVLIEATGPVAKIEIDWVGGSFTSVSVTDIAFDPPTASDDTLIGGAGDDTFIYTAGDGNDTIADFNTGNSGTLDDGNSTNNDYIDLSAFYDDIWELYADQADDGILNQSNNGVDGVDYSDNSSFGTGSLTFTGATADGDFFTVENTGVVCYAAGTRILTPDGEVAVETLRVGDEVTTCDHGAQPIRWIRRTRHEWSKEPNEDKPILIGRGSLGADLPARDLLVSPQHRMLIPDPDHPGGVLAPAKALTVLTGVRQMKGRRRVDYLHLMFDRHEVLLAEGTPSESFFPGEISMRNLSAQDRNEIRKVVLRSVRADGDTGYEPAREIWRVNAARRRLAALGCVWDEARLEKAGLPQKFQSGPETARQLRRVE